MSENKEYLPSVVSSAQPGNWLMILDHPEKLHAMAEIMVASGMFDPSDADERRGLTEKKAIAQAIVKIQAGFEYGLTPFIAMKSLHQIKGKIILSYQLVLGKVRQAGYDYKIRRWEPDGAKIEFFGHRQADGSRESLGFGEFTTEDAVKANLAGGNWVKHRKVMMLARAATQGVNAHLADVFSGPVYCPEDFNATVVGDTMIADLTLEEQVANRAAVKAAEKAQAKSAKKPEKTQEESEPEDAEEIKPTTEDSLEALKEVAGEHGKTELAAAAEKSLESFQKPKRGISSVVMAGAKTGWKPPQVLAFCKKEFPGIGLEEFNEEQWESLLKHVRTFPPVGL